jgi:hypothetical protein
MSHDLIPDDLPRHSRMMSDETMARVMCALAHEFARVSMDPDRLCDLDLFADDALWHRDRQLICQVVHFGLPQDAAANLLRLPVVRQNARSTTLHYRYFQDELRIVPIVLTNIALPQHLTRTRDGLAIVSLAGTRAEVWTHDGVVLHRVRTFLHDRLGPYQIDPAGEDEAEGAFATRR